jgi:CubicO group peptidase (beta-lactamase class C family)
MSTVGDMANWEVALQTGRILSPQTQTEMWTAVRLNNGSEYPYGYGWEVDYFPNGVGTTDVPMIRHEGSIPGFRAVYWRLPNQRVTVIVLSNLRALLSTSSRRASPYGTRPTSSGRTKSAGRNDVRDRSGRTQSRLSG